MGFYFIKSIIREIAKGVEALIEQNMIKKNQKVLLYGLDRYSFAMRTILSNFGYNNVEGYVSEDEEMVQKLQIEIKNLHAVF